MKCRPANEDGPGNAEAPREADERVVVPSIDQKPDPGKAIEFLSKWKPEGAWILGARDTGPMVCREFTDAEQMRAWIAEQQGRRRNVYFQANDCRLGANGKPARGDVMQATCLHVDIDPQEGVPIEAAQAQIQKTLDEFGDALPAPTVDVMSGGGRQLLWRLDEPVEFPSGISGDDARRDFERYNQQIAKMLGGDNCHPVCHLLRLPGTVNFPGDDKREKNPGRDDALAHVVSATWETHPLDDFMKAPTRKGGSEPKKGKAVAKPIAIVDLGDAPRIAPDALEVDPVLSKLNERTKVAIVQGHDPDQPLTGDNSRSEWVWHVACEMVRHDVDDDTMYSILTDPDLGISEHIRAQGNAAAQHRAAMRTIQRAKENAIDPWLAELNDEFTVIKSFGGKCRVMTYEGDKPQFMSFGDFSNAHCNRSVQVPKFNKDGERDGMKSEQLGKWWLHHPMRAEYDRLVFDPSKDHGNKVLNLWQGLAVEPKPADWSLIERHMREIVCDGDENLYQYLLKSIAWKLQNPGGLPRVAFHFLGDEGTGKGTLWNVVAPIFGQHAIYFTSLEPIVGRFNAILMRAVIGFADECYDGASPKAADKLKGLVTDRQIPVEPKGVDVIHIDNHFWLWTATNREQAMHIGLNDRRNVFFPVSSAKMDDPEWFEPLYFQIENGGRSAFLHHCLAMVLGDFHPSRARPDNAEKDRQRGFGLQGFERVLSDLLHEGGIYYRETNGVRFVPTDWLNDRVRKNGARKDAYNEIRNTLVGPQANHRGKPGMDWRPTREGERGYVLPPLKDARKRWKEVRRSGEWDDDDDRDWRLMDAGNPNL